jgi:hypothetical protein
MPKYSLRNTWGGNEISHLLYYYIEETLPVGKTILELGSGWGTSQLMKQWNVWSIESELEWLAKFNKTQSLFVPIKDRWYDPKILKESLDGLKYNLLLVDGPYVNREGFIEHFSLFNPKVPIVFDDVKRDRGKAIASEIAKKAGRPFINHNDEFGVV